MCFLKKLGFGVGEMAQKLRVLAALPEDTNFVPGIYFG